MPKETFFKLPAEKQAKIIQVLKKEFMNKAYQEVTVKTIVEQLDMARGSFYQYFQDLEDSYFYLLDQETEDIHLLFMELFNQNQGNLIQALEDFGEQLVSKIYDPAKYALYKNRYLNWSDQLNQHWNEYHRDYYRGFFQAQNSQAIDREVVHYVKSIVHGLIERLFREELSATAFKKIYQRQIRWIKEGVN